jgi:predicted nucleotidyltransferase
MGRDQVIATLKAHEKELRAAGVVRLSLFGSTARGDRHPDSDVDLLAAFDETRRLKPCVPSKDPVQRFEDILENISRIEQFHAGMDLAGFVSDLKTYDAVERCLERISEASKKLGGVAEELCPDIPWAQDSRNWEPPAARVR